MPADPSYHERGMYSGGQGGLLKSFSFLYRLPAGISGEKVLLHWKYITANSVSASRCRMASGICAHILPI